MKTYREKDIRDRIAAKGDQLSCDDKDAIFLLKELDEARSLVDHVTELMHTAMEDYADAKRELDALKGEGK